MATLQWIVAAITAAFVAVVAFLRWRTAQQKAALELKDRQLKLYETVKDCVDQFSINSQRFDSELQRKFLKAIDLTIPETFLLRADEVIE